MKTVKDTLTNKNYEYLYTAIDPDTELIFFVLEDPDGRVKIPLKNFLSHQYKIVDPN